jgi:DNA-binding transcriptional LysR family regulator
MEDLNKIQTFVCVAEERSFTVAARKLHMTPSAVSKQITDLEAKLGLTLLNRSTRGVALTDAGEKLFEQGAQALEDLNAAVTAARDLQGAPQGMLRLHVVTGYAQWVLAPLLARFMARYPTLHLEVTTNTPALSLVKARADLVISGKTLPDPGVAYRDLGPVPYVVCAAPDYFHRHGKPARPEDLADHNCLIHTVFAPKTWPFTVDSRQVSVRVRGTLSSSSSEVLLQAALQGVGIARLADYTVAADLTAGRLKPILEGMTRTIHHMRAYFPAGRDLPAKTTAFLDFLTAELAPSSRTARPGMEAAAPQLSVVRSS